MGMSWIGPGNLLCLRSRSRGAALVLALGAAVSASAAHAAETIVYTYDAKGRLVKVERSGSVNNGVTTTYTYDKADNRKNVTTTGATV